MNNNLIYGSLLAIVFTMLLVFIAERNLDYGFDVGYKYGYVAASK